MTTESSGSVASGRPHLVIDVAGRQPIRLDDFVGDTFFVAVADTRTFRVEGAGMPASDGVRFSQKDSATGKDLRVWRITGTADDQFEASTVSAY